MRNKSFGNSRIHEHYIIKIFQMHFYFTQWYFYLTDRHKIPQYGKFSW